MPMPIRAATSREPSAGVRGGRDHLGAHAAALHGLHDRVRTHLAGRAPGDLLRELAREVDELFGEEGAAARVLGERGEPVVRLGRGGDDADALAVVAAARRLDDGAAAVGVEEGLQLRRRR